MPEPERARRVGAAVATAFGLPPDKLSERLAAGSVRVKSGVSAAQADALIAELRRCGAACVKVAAGAALPAGNSPPLGARARPPPPPRSEPRPTPAPPMRPPLAAPAPARVTPDRGGRVAPLATAGPAHDPFAPPEMQAPPPELELAEEATVPDAAFSPPAAVPAAVPATFSAPAAIADETQTLPPASAAAVARAHAGIARSRGARDRLAAAIESVRARFVAGVVVAALAGLLAAHVVGAWREGSLEQSRQRVAVAAEQVSDQASWRALGALRAAELEAMRSRRAGIALSAGLVWIAVAGGVAFGWFRVADWSAIAGRLRRP